ncbi:MAG: Glu/Leu/Phe/Val dehydrogenase [Deltaproteobacteria bacterium]|nr:Glu/Leu/Phe/Val dehydrogenase [Candidatus Zymogenaceae bacterium]
MVTHAGNLNPVTSRTVVEPVQTPAHETLNSFEIVQRQLDECASFMNLDAGAHRLLRNPMFEMTVSIPVTMDDGTTRVFQGFRVQHNMARGPAKGGVRFHPDETIDTVRALATWMTWKCSLMGLPLGGGKGGVVCDTRELSPSELERLSREYVRAIAPIIGPDRDIPAPDVSTNPQVMAWMMDEYSRIVGKNGCGVVTGKPICVGGSQGRLDATARGGMYTIREAAKMLGMNLDGARVAVQGFGNAGSFAAWLIRDLFGSTVVAVSDTGGGVYSKRGLNPEAVLQHKRLHRSVCGAADCEVIPNEEIFGLDVDILILAGIENAVTQKNAGDVRARIVAELANGPTTPEADAILIENGVHIIPDFLCNAGGVTVSYFEMVQNYYMYYWEESEVHKRLDQKMTEAYHSVYHASQEYGLDMRRAASVLAVDRVTEAMRCRGWIN